VIPARGGSKGIPGKNMRMLQGRPLIGYILEVATSCPTIDEIVVSSDDSDILNYASSVWGARTRLRANILSGDDVTLDPVVYDAVESIEHELGVCFDIVVTLQPTSPTLSAESLQDALSKFVNSDKATCVSVASDVHLRWQLVDGVPYAVQKQRLNRQYLPQEYRETGAFVITRRDCVTHLGRFGETIELYPLPKGEAVDIDDAVDWLFAETILRRHRIALIVRGSKTIGLGHTYRGLVIADSLLGHDLGFCAFQSDSFVVELIQQRGYTVSDASNDEALYDWIRNFNPDIVLCDILDTSHELVQIIQALGAFTVTFEDLGAGSHCADLVFNALYELSSPPKNHRFGSQFVCLPSPFHIVSPAPFRTRELTALITFGGTDECNLTYLSCQAVAQLLREGLLDHSIVILGPGYAHDREFGDMYSALEDEIRDRISVFRNVQNMANMMSKADVGITSNGRTVYELAAMGVPSVCMAQNNRETSHLFARYSAGFKYLGIGGFITAEDILGALSAILADTELREQMRSALLEVNLRGGLRRVKEEILGEYWRWKDEGSAHRVT